MVLFTPKKLTFKGSKKQHQILTQTAYYQAGKIVVQTILPEQPPVALITLNTLGTTCSTSADTYIPIENIYNTQSCSFLESRLVSLYGGKAASLLIEYQQRFTSPYPVPSQGLQGLLPLYPLHTPYGVSTRVRADVALPLQGRKLAKHKMSEGSKADITTKTKLINNVQNRRLNPFELTLLQKKVKGKTHLVRTCFAGAGNNIFQSTLGNREIQTATHLARIMVNYWNFYSLNKTSLYSLFTKYAPKAHKLTVLHSKVSINSRFVINKLANFHNLPQYSDTQDPPKLRATHSFYPLPKGSGRAQLDFYGLAQLYPIPKGSGLLPLRGQQLSSWQNKEGLLPQYLPHTQKVKGTHSKGGIRGQEQRDQEYIEKDHNLLPEQEDYNLLPEHENLQHSATQLRKPLQGELRTQSVALQGVKEVRGKERRRGMKYLENNSLLQQQKGCAIAKESETEGYAKYEYNVRVWGLQLKEKDKTPQDNIIYRVHHNLYFAIVQSKNSLKICENKNSSYSIQRLSVENIGNYSQLNNSNFQLINSLQFSNLQRDSFYPNWFRLYLPDMEATKFLKNVANYYFSLGLQTLTFPSIKYSYNFTLTPVFTSYPKGQRYTKQSLTSYYKWYKSSYKYKSSICTCKKICTASPFLTFLNKNTRKDKYKFFIPNIISYSYCPTSILVNSTTYKFTKKRFSESGDLILQNPLQSDALQAPRVMKVDYIKNPSFTKITKDQLEPLNVPFSLLLENHIFPLNYNGFSLVEKELLYNALVNSSFAKAFYLINQNRQLLDFFVDYLLRFQILRQHQILYLFSTLLLGCNKIA